MKMTIQVTIVVLLLSTLAYSSAKDCDFENGMCDWKHDLGRLLLWTRRQGMTHGGVKGCFMSMNTWKDIPFYDASAGLYIKFTGDTCLTFWYKMKGIGARLIEVIVDNDQLPVLALDGPTKPGWHKKQVEITGVNNKITLIGTRGKRRRGFIAIDDILFTDSCEPKVVAFRVRMISTRFNVGFPIKVTHDRKFTKTCNCPRVPDILECVRLEEREKVIIYSCLA
ncbi:hypothetical protein ACROYT_G007933 [Oculina patagonica]